MNKKHAIYYLEDKAEHFKNIAKAVKRNLNIHIYPSLENWEKELEIFQEYMDDTNKTTETKVMNLLLNYKLDLVVLDQTIRDATSVGTRIYEDIIRPNSAFKDLEVIFFSGAKEDPDMPKKYSTAKFSAFSKKGQSKKNGIFLCDQIKDILEIPDDSLIARFKATLNRVKTNTNKQSLWKH